MTATLVALTDAELDILLGALELLIEVDAEKDLDVDSYRLLKEKLENPLEA